MDETESDNMEPSLAVSDLCGVTGASPAEAIPDDLPGHWWVAHTRPRQEKALARDFQSLGVFHYLPLCRRATRSRNTGRISRSLVPMFPGYVFFNGTDQQRHRVLRTNRIANTLEVVYQRQFIAELRQIQKALNANAGFERHGLVKVGDWARVVAGPLTGVEGIVCKHLKHLSGFRLALNVRILSQSVSVEVSPDRVERIDGPSYAA